VKKPISFSDTSKKLAVLIDPDKVDWASFAGFVEKCSLLKVGYFFVGGSLVTQDQLSDVIAQIKRHSDIPVVIFPGSMMQINNAADGILLLSLISGRNPEYLIGQHVVSAPYLKASGLQIISTGYILIDSGIATTVSYISNSQPIPANKPEIAACTAMAGEMLGLSVIYLDGGSGALNPVPAQTIRAVRKTVNCPIIVGGGINTIEKAENALQAGADIIVVGNALEKTPDLLDEMAWLVNSFASIPSI
jgi:phosphoglycerol geranylgeranyltransferase